jgi:hypothetical protein
MRFGGRDDRIVRGKVRHGMYPYGPDTKGEAVSERLRGVFEDGQHVGPSAPVPGVRACGVLRLFTAQTCDEAFSEDEASDYAFDGAGGELGLVLHR